MNLKTKWWKLIPLIIAAVSLAACDFSGGDKKAPAPRPCESVDLQIEKIQLESAQKQADLNLQSQKNDREIRLKIIDRCIAKDGVLLFFNGNIDCRITSKK